MPNHTRVHHLRAVKKKEPLDYLVYFFMVATPLFELPQLYLIYSTQSSEGISVWTWSFFMMASAVWLVYGFKRRVLPLAVTSLLYFVIELAIVTGIFIYQ